MDIEGFLRTFVRYYDEMVNVKTTHGRQFQRCLKRTCAVELRRTFVRCEKDNSEQEKKCTASGDIW
jgi:dephospho-CoA kinase